MHVKEISLLKIKNSSSIKKYPGIFNNNLLYRKNKIYNLDNIFVIYY